MTGIAVGPGPSAANEGGGVRTLLQFMGVWGGFVAITAAYFALLMWLLSIDDDPRDKRVASALLWAMFWPIIPFSAHRTDHSLC
jgi:hypothetical protein